MKLNGFVKAGAVLTVAMSIGGCEVFAPPQTMVTVPVEGAPGGTTVTRPMTQKEKNQAANEIYKNSSHSSGGNGPSGLSGGGGGGGGGGGWNG